VATSAENPEKISANDGSMEALIKRRLQLPEELAFLRAHLSQLSEKIMPALPPGQEEAKRKAGGNSGNEI